MPIQKPLRKGMHRAHRLRVRNNGFNFGSPEDVVTLAGDDVQQARITDLLGTGREVWMWAAEQIKGKGMALPGALECSGWDCRWVEGRVGPCMFQVPRRTTQRGRRRGWTRSWRRMKGEGLSTLLASPPRQSLNCLRKGTRRWILIGELLPLPLKQVKQPFHWYLSDFHI